MSVAHCYSNGKGVDKNYDKAYEYHKMAADKGMLLFKITKEFVIVTKLYAISYDNVVLWTSKQLKYGISSNNFVF